MASLALAGAGYLLWNAQLNPLLNVAAPFFGLFNAAIATLNLAPGYPFDGARLVRGVTSGACGSLMAARVVAGLGYAVAAGLAGWGLYQLAQHVRFGAETGGISLALAALAFLGLRAAPAWPSKPAEADRSAAPMGPAWLLAFAGLLVIGMLIASASILPVTSGIEMPGVALSVEPMVEVPAAYHHVHGGTFILTSVIEQTPITLGEWAFGKLSPQVRLLPPQEIVPPGTTLQQQARAGFRMLDESEVAATVAGLRMAASMCRPLARACSSIQSWRTAPALACCWSIVPGGTISLEADSRTCGLSLPKAHSPRVIGVCSITEVRWRSAHVHGG